jgi:hypothetical protein
MDRCCRFSTESTLDPATSRDAARPRPRRIVGETICGPASSPLPDLPTFTQAGAGRTRGKGWATRVTLKVHSDLNEPVRSRALERQATGRECGW